jgi:hypothetical protein
MKFRPLLVAVVVLFFSALSHADSMDSFVLSGPVFTWSWMLPSAPAAGDPDWLNHNPPGVFGFDGISVFTDGPAGFGIGEWTSHDLFFQTANSFELGCNSSCGQFARPTFTFDLYSGTFADPIFRPGTYVSLDGKTTLTITAIPEGPQIAMIGIAGLGLLAALKKKYGTRALAYRSTH